MKTHTRHIITIIALTIAILIPTAAHPRSKINWEVNAGPVYINGTTDTFDPGCYYCIHHRHHKHHKHVKQHHHKKHRKTPKHHTTKHQHHKTPKRIHKR